MYKKVKHIFECLLLVLTWLFFTILPLNVTLFLGKLLGEFFFKYIGYRKKIALSQLKDVFQYNNKEIYSIALETYKNLGRSFVEFLHLTWESKRSLHKRIKIQGIENLDNALKLKKGVIIVTGHFGNWEIMGALVASLGPYYVNYVVRPLRNPYSHIILKIIRRRWGINEILQKHALKVVVKKLRNNELVAILIDQDEHERGIFVNFLGKPASTSRVPAFFSYKTGAPIVPCFIVRQSNTKEHIVFFEPYFLVDQNDNLIHDKEKIMELLTQKCSDRLQEWVKKYPQNWFWNHRRWKSKPTKSDELDNYEGENK